MIDLSFLTEEEQEAIMKVLQRDADLKKAEEERVRVLEETVDDTNELKNKTGQWFYEAKSKRHRDKIHGADLIRASIRKKKPQTIAELSQSRTDKAKKSWVNNVNKDIFIPPELFGVMEEPEKEEEEEKTHAQYYRSVPRVDNLSVDETNASFQKAVSSPSKQRRNPFNDAALDDDFLLTSENRLSENGSPRLQQIPGKGIMPPSRKSQSSKTFPKSESKEVSQTSSDAVDGSERHGEQIPKPKVRTVTYKIVDPQSDSDSSFPKPTKRTDSMNGTSARKGILKRSPSSSSTDSEILRISQTFDSQSKSVLPTTPIIEGEAEKNYVDDIPDESSQYSIDRLKQVRFTSADVQDELPLSPDTHKGKEIGEFHLLESDFGKNAMDNIDGFQYLHSELGSTENGMPVHPETIDLDGDVAVTVSEEKDGDATPYQSLSSSVDHNLIADVPQLEQTPSSSTIRIDSQSSTYELSQEKGSPPAVTTVRPPKEISVNINENGMPASELLIESDSTDLSNPELQPSKLTVDQQPIYATVKSPRVSKLDSSDIQQGKESIDETDPSCKTDTMFTENIRPNHDDERQNFNVLMHTRLLISNTNVQDKKELTNGKSKTGDGKCESAAIITFHQEVEAEGPKEGKYVAQTWKNEATEHSGEQLLLGKSSASGAKRSYETTENPVVKLQEAHLLIRTEKPMSDLDNRSKLDLECVDSSKKYLKASEQDDVENTKCSEKIQGDYAGSTVGVYNKDVKGHGPSFFEEDVAPSARVTWKRPQILEQREALPSLETNRLNFRIEKQPEESPENAELSHQSQFIKLPSEHASYPEEKVRQHTHNDSLTYKKESETSHRKIREVVQTVFSPKANNGQSNNGLEEPMKDDFEYANKTVGAGKIPHTLSIKEQQHIIECLRKDTVEIVEKKEVPPKAKISEFNIAIQKLHREVEHESSHPNHSKSVNKSSENSFQAEQKRSFETRMQDSIDNNNSSEDEASFTEGEGIVEKTIVLPKADLNMSHIVSPLSMDQPMEEQHLSEFPREKAVPHGETEIVQKMIAQPKANLHEFNNRLEKLHKEASVTLSPVNQTGTAVVELQENVSTPEQNLPGCPKEETIEHVEKTMSPPKDTVSEFNTRLDKMHKESSSPSYHETQEQQSFSESLRENPFQKEVSEVTLKTVAPPKYDLNEFNINLKKLIVESTLPSPAVQQTLNGVVKMQEKHTIEHQSIFESPNEGIVDKAVALPNTEFRVFNTVVEEPFKTSTSPARHKTPGEKSSFKYPVDKSLPQEVNELVVRSDAPQKADRFRDNLEKLSLEASESICPVHQKPRAMGKISVEVSTQEQQNLFGCLREDIVDPAEKTVPKVEFSESNTGLAKLLKESSSPQYHKTPEEKMPFELPRAEVHSIEVRNVDVKDDGPSKVLSNEFKIGLANISEEKSKASFPVFQQATVVMNIKEKHSTQEQLNLVGHLSEEVIEPAQNRVALLKADVNEFDTGLGAFSTEPSSPSHLGSPGQNCSFEHPTEETPPQEVEEIIERRVALSKADEFKKCLEKLSMENSLSRSPVHQKTSGVVKIQGDDSTQEEKKHFECPTEFVETLDKTIAQPKEEHSTFNTRLYKLFEESTSPLQHKTLSDQSSFKLPQGQVFPQDATIKSIAPPTADLNEGFKNLHKEAPESSLPVLQKASVVIKIQGKDSTQKQKSHDGTPGEEFVEFAGKTVTPQTADLTEHHNGLETPLHHKTPVQKGSLEQRKEETLKEVEEVVIKAVVAPKADLNEFNSSLFKLFTENSLSSSPVHQEARGKATIQEDDFTHQKQSLFEFPEEDTVERTVAPPKSNPKAFRAALNKLEKDALHMSSLPTQSESVKAFNSNASQPEQGNIFEKEIQYSYDSSSCIKMVAVAQKEVVKKATAPPKTDFCEFSDGLEKPLKESAYSSYQTHGQPGSSNPHQKDAPPQDVNEVFVRTVTPSKANLNEFHNSLEKLHMEASVSSPLHQQIGEVVENHEDSTQEEQNHFGCPRKEIVATVEETMLQPNVEHSELNTSFNNQLDKSSSPLHPNVLEEQTSYKLHREKVLDQTVMEVIVKTAVPPNTDLEEFRTGLKKLHKEASTSLPVLQKAAVVNNIQENDSTQKPDGHTREEVVEIAGNTVTQQTADIPEHHVEAPLHHKMLVQKSSLEHRRKEALQDVKEVVLKAVPQKSDLSDFNSSLKLFTEASLSSSSPVHQEASRKADIQEEDSTHQKQILFECPKEDTVERTVAPPKSELIAFRAGLKKLQKEAPDMCSLPAQSGSVKAFHSNASQPEQKNVFKKEMQHSYDESLGSVNMVAVLRKEGKETVVKETTTPETDFCECSAGLEKPLKESYSSCRETLEQQGSSESPKEEAPPQEVNEVIVRTVAPPKAVLGEFHNALEKLHVESLVSSPVDEQVDEVVNAEEDSTREEENHFGCSRKENATNVKETVARPKVECSEVNISLNVQHEESSCLVHQKTSEEQISFKLPTEKVLPQEVITKTAVPPKADLNKFKTVLQKIQKEASQSLPVLQKATVVLKVKEQGSTQTKQSPTGHPIEAVVESAGNTVSLPTANLCEIDTRLEAALHKQLQEQKRSLEHPREEALLQEVKKVIVKDVTPPKTDLSDYNRLKKKCIETSLSPPAHQEARGEAMVKEDSPHQKKSLCELPKEESVERTTAPPKSDLIEFRAGLKKLQKETSDMCSLPTCESVKAFNKNAYPPEPATFLKNPMKSSLNASSVSLKTDAVLWKEVETVEKATTVPQTDFCELSAVLEKPLIESSSYQTLAPHGSSIEPPKEEETPQEVKEVFIRAVSPPKASLNEFNNALQKLHGESLVSTPVDKLVGEVAKSQEEDSTQEEQNHFGCPRKEIVATVEMTVAQPNVEHSELKTGFIKQHEGSSFPLLHNTLQEQSCFKLTGKQVLPQEVKEVIVKTAVPPNDDLKEFKTGLQKLHKEASKSLPVLQKAAVVIKIPGKDCTQEQQSLIGGQNKVVVQTVEKAFVPPKAELCEINPDLSMLLEPSLPSGLMLPKQKHSFEHPMGGALLSHVKEVTVKTAALPEAELNKCDHGSGELLKEYSVSSSPVDQKAIGRTEIQDQILLGHPMTETAVTTATPKTRLQKSTTGLVKLHRGATLISSLPSQFESLTHNSEDASQSVQQPILEKIQTCSIASQNFMKMNVVPLKEVIEPVKKTSVPQKNVNEFNTGLEKLLKESSSALHHETMRPQHSSEQPKEDAPSHKVKEDIVRTAVPARAGLSKLSYGLEKLVMEATEPSHPTHPKASGVVTLKEISSTKKTQHSFKKVMHHRGSRFTDTQREIPKDIDSEAVRKEVSSPIMALSELLTGLKKQNKDVSQASSALKKNPKPLEDIHAVTFEGSPQGVHNVAHASQALGKLYRHTKLPIRESAIAGGHAQLVQSRLAVKSIQLSRNADGHRQEQSPHWVAKETLDKTVSVPKTEIGEFHIGFEKMCMEASEASTKLVQPADEDVYRHSQLDQVTFDERTLNLSPTGIVSQKDIQLPSEETNIKAVQRKLSTKNIQLNRSFGPQKEKPLPQEVKETVDKTIAVPKTELRAFHIGLEKLYKEASELSLPLHETIDHKEDSHESSSEKDQEGMRRTMHHGQTTSQSEEIVQLPRKDTVKDFSQPAQKRLFAKKIQLSHSSSDGHQQEQRLPQEVREAVVRTVVLPKMAPSASDVFENICTDASKISDTLNKTSDNSEASFGNISEQDQERLHKIMHLGQMANTFQEIIQLPNEKKDLREQHSQAVQRRLCTKKFQLNNSASAAYQREACLPQEARETVEKTVPVPKTEAGTFHIGYKMYTETSEASPTLDKSDDKQDTYGIIPVQTQERMNPTISLGQTARTSQNIIQLSNGSTGPKEHASQLLQRISVKQNYTNDDGLPQNLRGTIDQQAAVEKPELVTFPLGFEKQYWEASEATPTLDEATDNRKDNYGKMSEQDHEGMYRTMHLCQTSTISRELMQLPSREKDPREEHSQRVQRRLSTKKIQLNISASDGYQKKECVPQESGETDETVNVLKTEHREFHVTLETPHKDALETSPTLLETIDNKKEHSEPLERRLSTKKILRCHNIYVHHQQEKSHPQEVIEPLKRAVTTKEENMHTADLEKLQQTTQCDSRAAENHAPVSQSEKWLLHQNVASLSLNKLHSTGPIGKEMSKCGNQQKRDAELIEDAHVENEAALCKPDERPLMFLHNATHTNVARAIKTFQPAKNSGEVTLIEDSQAGNSDEISAIENTQDLSASTSFMRETPLVKDKEKTKVKISSIELRLYSPYEEQNASRRFGFNRSERDINLYAKGWRNSPSGHF